MLAPLFANMSADHPQRVAKWLGEVFGGRGATARNTAATRGCSPAPRQGPDRSLAGAMVALLLQSASEAGLPNDAEFRSAFQAYIEWGSRLAVENSQSGAKPPEHMPMPHWDWSTGPDLQAAGPRQSRPRQPEEPVTLPAADEPVRFEKHVRQLFRGRDRQSMRFAFDLWSHEDVQQHALTSSNVCATARCPATAPGHRSGSTRSLGGWKPAAPPSVTTRPGGRQSLDKHLTDPASGGTAVESSRPRVARSRGSATDP